jgi:diguanylate cyclase (GGDEF)-like protein/PAS domain S-box-containing protein
MEISLDYKAILDSLHDGVYFVDRQMRIIYWNSAAERITGYSAGEVMASPCSDNIRMHVDEAGKALCKEGCPLAATLQDGQSRDALILLRHKAGHQVPIDVRVTPQKNDRGETVGAIELFANASAHVTLKLQLEELKRLVLLDSLTQLPNRRYLESQINSSFALFRRGTVPFGFLFFDIDYFKRFNDQYGHDVGDLALQTIAKTLRGAVRPFDSIGRWGGEEFAAVLPNVDGKTLAVAAGRLRLLVSRSSVEAKAAQLAITVSVGGTVARADDSVASLVKRADTLMYRSKEKGRDCVTIEETDGEEA